MSALETMNEHECPKCGQACFCGYPLNCEHDYPPTDSEEYEPAEEGEI